MSKPIDSLNNLRYQIDLIDKDIAALFEQRMSLTDKIAQVKQSSHISTLDKHREAEKLILAENMVSPEIRTQFQALLSLIMNASRESQNASQIVDETTAMLPYYSDCVDTRNLNISFTILYDPSLCTINQIINRFSILGYEVISFKSRKIVNKDILNSFGCKNINQAKLLVKSDSTVFDLNRLTSTSSDIFLSIDVDN